MKYILEMFINENWFKSCAPVFYNLPEAFKRKKEQECVVGVLYRVVDENGNVMEEPNNLIAGGVTYTIKYYSTSGTILNDYPKTVPVVPVIPLGYRLAKDEPAPEPLRTYQGRKFR